MLQLIDSSRAQGEISEKIGVFTVPENMAHEIMGNKENRANCEVYGLDGIEYKKWIK